MHSRKQYLTLQQKFQSNIRYVMVRTLIVEKNEA